MSEQPEILDAYVTGSRVMGCHADGTWYEYRFMADDPSHCRDCGEPLFPRHPGRDRCDACKGQ